MSEHASPLDYMWEMTKGLYENHEAQGKAHEAHEKHDWAEEAQETMKQVAAKMGFAGAAMGALGVAAAPAAGGAALAGVGAGAAAAAGIPAAAAVGLGIGHEMDKAWHVSDNLGAVGKDQLDADYKAQFGGGRQVQDVRGARGIAGAERKMQANAPLQYNLMKNDQAMQALRAQNAERDRGPVVTALPLDYAAPWAK